MEYIILPLGLVACSAIGAYAGTKLCDLFF